MLPDVTKALCWLEAKPEILAGIGRGIERESLRVQADGKISTQGHPQQLGSALTHDWIITDFAEALMEFVTPVDHDTDHLLAFLRDLHRHVAKTLRGEQLWPFSLPGPVADPDDIQLASYGKSNLGQMKHIYRQGLKHRYGSLMQVIAGIHYNFSLPICFWEAVAEDKPEQALQEIISAGYLRLIRNYYRFGWIIPYLFGASPALCETFLQGNQVMKSMETDGKGTRWLPFATSLRLSDLGYTNNSQSNLSISFNSLDEYVAGVKQAIKTPSQAWTALGIRNAQGERIQLNTNVLQIENELYAPIRPKRVIRSGEAPSDALKRGGIEYIEVRSLDVNPFSATGISAEQVRFIDLFLVWCVLADSPEINPQQLSYAKQNWNKVVTEGRKPGLALNGECGSQHYLLKDLAKGLFADLRRIAAVMDNHQNQGYVQTCEQLAEMAEHPELTFSARILQQIQQQGFVGAGLALAEKYRQELCSEQLEILSDEVFAAKAQASYEALQKIESADTLSLEEYLASRQGQCQKKEKATINVAK